MRIKLNLQSKQTAAIFPINYQYPLSAAIYTILTTASPEYADFLHNKGYISQQGKPLKLFTFSRLWGHSIRRYKSNFLILPTAATCTLLISSPMLEDFIQNFVIGLFQNQEIVIGNNQTIARLTITNVETLAHPEIKATNKFTCLSPIVVSTMHEYNGKLSPYYYRPGDDNLDIAIINNLLHKFETIHKKPASNQQLKFEPDWQYMYKREKSGKHLTKKITIKEGNQEQESNIIGFEVPFTLQGSAELILTAWECGIGDKNSMGFGMIDLITS